MEEMSDVLNPRMIFIAIFMAILMLVILLIVTGKMQSAIFPSPDVIIKG